AAFEAPFVMNAPGPQPSAPAAASGESYGPLDAASTRDALDYLASHGVVHASGGQYRYASEAFPASHVSLRNVGWDNFVIVEQGVQTGRPRDPEGQIEPPAGAPRTTTARPSPTERTIGELDYRAAHTMLHEQAIYQQDAEQYQVERLDFENHKAYVRKVQPDYFTTALSYRTVSVLDTHYTVTRPSLVPGALITQGFSDVKVLERVTGYKKIKFFTHENAGYGDVHLPEMEMHTTSYFLTVPDLLLASIEAPRSLLVDALRGIGHALEAVASLALMCDPRDINQTLADGDQSTGEPSASVGTLDPTLFLFDAQPGGVGLAERLYHIAPELFQRARQLIENCPCESGCPACVSPAEHSPRKRLALLLLG